MRRKNTCKPKLKNISIEDIYNYYFNKQKKMINIMSTNVNEMSTNVNEMSTNVNSVLNNTIKCIYCKKKFKSRQGKWQHEKKSCKIKKQMNDLNNLQKLVKLLNEQLKEKDKQLNLKLKEKDKQISDLMKKVGVNIGTQNIQNIQNNIKILAYNKTDMTHLKDKNYIKFLSHSNLNIHYSKNLKLFTDYINCLNKLLLSTTIIDLYIYNNCKWSKIDTFGTDLTCCANNNIHYKYSVLNLLDNKTYSLTRKVSSKKPMCCFNKDDWKAYNNVKGKFGQIGDPHIATINGEHYDFNHIGYLRYFNNENLIINVKTDHGDYENWANNDYIRQVYIRYNNNYCLVDTGFRGKPVKILINNNFNIKEEKLEFNKKALRYAGYSNFKSNNEQKINDYLNNSPFDVVPKLIRNKITFYINENFDLEIVNVNQYNLQPCRLFLNIKNKMNSSNWKGLVVDRKWAYSSILESIYDISDIKLISNKIPNLTTPSKLLNKTWE